MGKHLSPRCPDCDIALTVELIGRGALLGEMLFALTHCPKCGVQYDAWCNPEGYWSYKIMKKIRGHRYLYGNAVDFCAPWDVLIDYKPE